jgi:hypothetical protein
MLDRMRNSWRPFPLALATSVSLFGASALAAPTVSLAPQPTPVVTRVDSKGNLYTCPTRNTPSCIVDNTTQGVGSRDCTDDTSLRFNVALTGVPDPGYDLQVWAGTTDCTQPGATNNATTGTCWKVAQDPILQVLISPFDVRVADVVSGIGVTPPPQTYSAAGAAAACNAAKAAAPTGVSIVTIYFMVFATGANAAPVSSASYPVKVKLVGPNAVSGLTASGGAGEILLDWTPPQGDPTLQGFDLFAVREGTTLGGSTATCSGATGSVDVSTIACPSGDGGASACQLLWGATATSGTVNGLANDATYVGAVAPVDEYGNQGSVAQPACATSTAADGGTSTTSSGGCSCEAGASDSRFGLGFASAALVALVVVTRRKRARP